LVNILQENRNKVHIVLYLHLEEVGQLIKNSFSSIKLCVSNSF
jgi:hypothetical protein